MQEEGIEPENTRVRKTIEDGSAVYKILQASHDTGIHPLATTGRLGGSTVLVEKGDHRNQVSTIGC